MSSGGDDAALKTAAPNDRLFRISSRANVYYKEENFTAAAAEYTRALDLLRPNRRLSNATDFTALLFGNRSACYCMLRKFEDALRDAELAVRIRPKWSKVYPWISYFFIITLLI